MWFIKFIIIVTVVYLLGYLFFRLLLPWLLKRMVKRFANKMNTQFDEPKKNKKFGSVNIDYIPENQNNEKENDDKGDYIDFEEV